MSIFKKKWKIRLLFFSSLVLVANVAIAEKLTLRIVYMGASAKAVTVNDSDTFSTLALTACKYAHQSYCNQRQAQGTIGLIVNGHDYGRKQYADYPLAFTDWKKANYEVHVIFR